MYVEISKLSSERELVSEEHNASICNKSIVNERFAISKALS